ncbi:MAG: hypothetical protein NXI31_00500 [bacterium]|nr:hypothetical protein [bacterium]
MSRNHANRRFVEACLAVVMLVGGLPSLLAQEFVPLHGLSERVEAAAYCPASGRPVAVSVGHDGLLATFERRGVWQRRVGEAKLPLDMPRFWTDPLRGRVLAFGFPASGTTASGYEWDGVRWSPVPGRGIGFYPAVAFDPVRDRALAFGGVFGNTVSGLQAWDGNGWTVVPITGPAPAPRRGAAFGFDPVRGRAVLFGGLSLSASIWVRDTWEWDGASWRQFTGAMPSWRAFATFGFEPQLGKLVLFGGNTPAGNTNETWSFDGVRWHQLHSPVAPSPRAAPALIETPSGLLHIGGDLDRGGFEEWRFAGGNWRRSNLPERPQGRIAAAMAFDSVRGQAVMFGGLRDVFGATTFADTWTYDGQWRRQTPARQPGWRFYSAFEHDPARGESVMFGGRSANNGLLGETWVFDGSDWHERLPSVAPSPRAGSAMVWDTVRGELLLFGGTSANGDLAETWAWNGSNWRFVAVTNQPPPRARPFFGFDAPRGRAVLFGGEAGTSQLQDTWTFDGATWRQEMPSRFPAGVRAAGYDSVAAKVRLYAIGTVWSWDGSDWLEATLQRPATMLGRDSATCFDGRLQRFVAFGSSNTGLDQFVGFTESPAVHASFGVGCAAGGDAEPELFVTERARIGNPHFGLGWRTAGAAQPAVLVVGMASTQVSIGTCQLLVDAPLFTLFRASGIGGFDAVELPLPQAENWLGAALHAQIFALQSAGLGASRRLRVGLGN